MPSRVGAILLFCGVFLLISHLRFVEGQSTTTRLIGLQWDIATANNGSIDHISYDPQNGLRVEQITNLDYVAFSTIGIAYKPSANEFILLFKALNNDYGNPHNLSIFDATTGELLRSYSMNFTWYPFEMFYSPVSDKIFCFVQDKYQNMYLATLDETGIKTVLSVTNLTPTPIASFDPVNNVVYTGVQDYNQENQPVVLITINLNTLKMTSKILKESYSYYGLTSPYYDATRESLIGPYITCNDEFICHGGISQLTLNGDYGHLVSLNPKALMLEESVMVYDPTTQVFVMHSKGPPPSTWPPWEENTWWIFNSGFGQEYSYTYPHGWTANGLTFVLFYPLASNGTTTTTPTSSSGVGSIPIMTPYHLHPKLKAMFPFPLIS